MMWNIAARGFLPSQDPLETLATTRLQYTTLTGVLENIATILPHLVEERRVREEIVYQLRAVSSHFDDEFINSATPEVAERAMLIYSYMASAYVFARHETPATRIPKEIAVPLVHLARKVGRRPILSYASYCLTNWRRLDQSKPVQLGNIELLQNFCTKECGQRDENWFILVHVDIEAKAGELVNTINDVVLATKEIEPAVALETLVRGLENMNRTLARMPEECDPDNYFRWVRPYIFSFKDVVYESCFNDRPMTFRGETGAQSSIVPLLVAVLGIKHEDSMLTRHLTEMRDYMPPQHQLFLQNVERWSANNPLREAAFRDPDIRNSYNECVKGLLEFRAKHFEYAQNYIAKKVDNPQGTGGTPYVQWLQQLRDETEAHLISGGLDSRS